MDLPSKRSLASRAAEQQPTYNLIKHKLPRRLHSGTAHPETRSRLDPFRPWKESQPAAMAPESSDSTVATATSVGVSSSVGPTRGMFAACSCSFVLCSQADNHLTLPPRPIISLPHALGGWVDDQVSNTTNQQPASPGRADDWPFLYHSSVLYCMILGRVLATPDLLISKSGPSLGDKMDQAHTSCHQHPLRRRCDLPSARHL